MRLPDQEPTVEPVESNTHESVERHPAYALAFLHATSQTPGAVLYGSDFRHHRYITISISTSHLKRGLSNDWPSQDDELIEISMSLSQFSKFIASEGDGGGTQCTLRRFNGKGLPPIAKTKDRTAQFNSEVSDKLKLVMETIDLLASQIDESKLSVKGKEELHSTLNAIKMNLSCNLDFVAKEFGKHFEKTKEQVMTEIHAYMQNAVQRSGIAIDNDAALPLELGHEKTKNP